MEEREANRLYELKACEMDQRAVKLAMAEEEARKALNTAQRDYNLALVCKGGVGIQCTEVCPELSSNAHGYSCFESVPER